MCPVQDSFTNTNNYHEFYDLGSFQIFFKDHLYNTNTIQDCIFHFPYIHKDVVDKVELLRNENRIWNFKNCLFERVFYVGEPEEIQTLDFTSCVFVEGFKIEATENIESLFFQNSRIYEELEISGCSIKLFFGLYSIVEGNLNISGCGSKSDFNFNSFDIYKELYINNSHFQNLKINQMNIGLSCKIDSVVIAQFFSIFKSKFSLLTMSNVFVEHGHLLMEETEIIKLNRGTAQIIKREAYNSYNTILALEYKSREYEEYRKELKWSGDCGKKLLLFFNKWSNNYGLNWGKGILFIIEWWVLCFSIFIMLRDGIGTNFIWIDPKYIEEAVNYLWILNGISGFSVNEDFSWFLVCFFILGKIMIGYGIYQTIAAFRKYAK